MTRPLNIAVLGATGSIGRQTLDVIDRNPARFKLFGLTEGVRSANREAEQLEALWVAVDHVQRLPADRTGGAEQRDVDWSRHVRRWKTVT